MFAYQTAAYRRSQGPRQHRRLRRAGGHARGAADEPARRAWRPAAADFMADHVFSHIDIPSWLARTGFQMLDPIKTAQVAAGLPASTARPRGAAAARTAAPIPGVRRAGSPGRGPAISELLKQFIAHNRMMTGGFSIHGELVTLTDIDCPVLAVIGEVDDIGQPAVGTRHQARRAATPTCTNTCIRAGHFGLVVGSKAATQTWPTVAEWVKWLDGDGDMPEGVAPMALQPAEHTESGRPVRIPARPRRRRGHRRWPSSLARSAGRRGGRRQQVRAHAGRRDGAHLAAAGPARPDQRPHPHLAGPDHVRAGARRSATASALLFDGRVHTYEAVDRRINNVVRGLIEVGVRQGARVGVLMETRPSALVAIAALSRLGAVAVLMPPDADLAAAARLGAVTRDHRRPEQPARPPAGCRLRVLVLGGGETRDLHLLPRRRRDVIDMEKIDPDGVDLPGWYRPNPGLATRPGVRRVQHDRRRTGGPPDHQLPLGAVGVRHRVGGAIWAAATPCTASRRCTTSPGCW